jgi:hypothetical protein
MLNDVADPVPIDYPRSILSAVTPVFDRIEQCIPHAPQPLHWNGHARTQYEVELARLRDLVILARAHHERLVEALVAVGSCG